MKHNILIVHYNTPKLTKCLIKSINKNCTDPIIYLFDNSDKYPFVNIFNNVKIIDNTKGQIINFDNWLKKYANKNKSKEFTGIHGSAKHCYSIEKCMDIINDNFLLLDSDVLIKKNIDELFDDKYLYIAETEIQKKSTIKRILPFICFINVKKCKQYNIHYFDDNYMHGLYKTKISDFYDTGAGFYINANKYQHKDIKYTDYIVHFKGGSWEESHDKHYGKRISANDWLNLNKDLWQNKNVIYTCITDNYDILKNYKYYNHNNFDYICFTDNIKINNYNHWVLKPIPNELLNLSKVKQQRCIKILPHNFLKNYDLSIWLDGSYDVLTDIKDFLNKILQKDISIYIPKHPFRNCIYEEANACIKAKKDKPEIINKQINKYKKEGFPKNYGLPQSNIIVRYHNNKDCIKLMNTWWDELKNNSHRDQLSFNYALWKNSNVKVKYIDKNIYNSKWFKWNTKHNSKETFHKNIIKTKRIYLKRAFFEYLH